MINDIINKFLDFNEDIKDEAWATEMVRLVMRDAKSIISKADYELGENILFGRFPETELDKLFVGKHMVTLRQKLSVSTVYFFEKVRNALIDDRNSSGLTITVNSLDPEKEEKRKSDRELLQNKKGIESMLNEITANNGMPPTPITKDDFHGNVEVFDEMGYDEFDPTDLNNFFDAHWGLKQELFLQNPINAIFRLNQVSRNYDKYINDILITLHNWSQVYVDELEGSIKIEHLYPYEVQVLHATGTNDYKDAQGFNLPKTTNIRGLLKRFGSAFNFERDWGYLLTAATGQVNHSYTGIGFNEGRELLFGTPGQLMDFNKFLDAPINYGYCEFKTISETVRQKGINKNGNIVNMPVNYSSPQIDGWEKEIKYHEDTYRAYYLEVGSLQPKLIKWGKVYMQETEGQNDEYSGFSIKGNTRKGIPVVEILKPFWRMMNVSFKMFEMLVNDVKPDGFVFNYSTLSKLAADLQQAKDTPDDARAAIDNYLKMISESPNIITDTPTGDEGEVLGGGQFGVQPRKNGLNDAAKDLREIMDWCEQKAEKYLGTQGIELAEPRDGYKLSVENKKRTRAATAFIDFILLNHIEDISITTLNYTKDISKFKDIPAYKYMANLVGYKTMDFIASMKKAPHRYGTFLDTFNNDIELLEIRGMAQQALANKEIELTDYLVLRSFENPRQALAFLTRQKSKARKQQQMDAMTSLQQQDALAEKAFQRQLAIDNNKGKWAQAARHEEAKGFITAAQLNSQAQIQAKVISEQGQNERLAKQAINDIDKIAEEANINAQKPVI